MDLRGLTQKELKKLIADAEKALERAQKRDLQAARAAAEKAVAKFGVSLDELAGVSAAPVSKAPGKARKAKVKKAGKPKVGKARYANPANAKDTWTGRGRRPNWVIALDEKGVDRESYAL